jgi:membrane protein
VRVPGGGHVPFGRFLKVLYQHYENHAVSDTAAALSYYFIFALFPFLFFLATLAAYLPLGNSVDLMLQRAHQILPTAAMTIIDQHVHALIAQPRPKLLTLGLFFTLYSASRGVDALRKGANLAYDVKESRPFWRTEILAFAATIGGAVLVLFGIAALVVGGDAGFWVARRLGIESAYLLIWRWLRWPVTAAAIMLAAALGYYALPDVRQKFKFITPGSVIGTLFWLLATWGFSQYVAHFGNYNVTYGSIGGVIILMTWFYISGFIFLIGGEINAILEHASVEGKAPGARVEGETPPPPDERPSAVPVGAAGSAAAAARSNGGATTSGPP